MLKLKRILVATDFSAESKLALDWAVRLAKEETGASIVLCHVLPRIIAPVGPEAVVFEYSDYFQSEKQTIEKKLRRMVRDIPDGIEASYAVREGPVSSEIERLCKERAIELVIMTTHGRRGLSHLLHGSDAEETVRLAPCPVLVLHLNAQTQEMSQAS